ncbi:hypothetical protein [Psychromonas sp. MME1]|uniref:hypothetical protein n=1 Tax=Psychromonas sp. MME1 TaxID=3231032 RepID=UPI0034E25DBF
MAFILLLSRNSDYTHATSRSKASNKSAPIASHEIAVSLLILQSDFITMQMEVFLAFC